MAMEREPPVTSICTIGHSTLPLDVFARRLKHCQIEFVVDIRTIPRSRHNPQFDRDALPGALAEYRIGYLHMKSLGGLRRAKRDSSNTGFRNPSFRGFADYMETQEFSVALAELLDLALKQQTAIMCAEAVPWRCHRSLVADALVVRGVRVSHIMGDVAVIAHRLTPFARVNGLHIEYRQINNTPTRKGSDIR